MNNDKIKSAIELAWEDRDNISAETTGNVRDSVDMAMGLLDSGEAVSYTHLTLPTNREV